MVSPFDDSSRPMLVLLNGEAQMSLWPTATEVPEGWLTVFGPAGRTECLAYVEREWTDPR